MMNATLEIQNLKCGGCANTIVKRLSDLSNIENVAVNNDDDTVTFDYHDSNAKDEVIALLSKLGYPVVGNKNTLSKMAKSYVSCAVGRMSS